jgi:histidine ammonia-lyase
LLWAITSNHVLLSAGGAGDPPSRSAALYQAAIDGPVAPPARRGRPSAPHRAVVPVVIDRSLTWAQLARIAAPGTRLRLSPGAKARIEAAHAIVQAIVARNIRAYGVNTGVGALSEVIIPGDQLAMLSRNILMSHAVGIGAPLGAPETRAMMAATANNFAHGHSGLRLAVVQRIVDLLNADCLPVIPRQGSVGYISHRAHIGLALIGQGAVVLEGVRMSAAEALGRLALEPLVLEAKEGLCLVNGSACAAGLAALVVDRSRRILDWADAVAAMTFETQGCQLSAISPAAMALRVSTGLARVTARLNALLAGSGILAAATGRRTQDALSLRGIPQVHGAARDVWTDVADVADRELASSTDNPAVLGSPERPEVISQAHPMGAAIGLAMDHLATAMAQIGMMSERRLDRMVNPLVSGLPAFLAPSSGVESGFMIAQYAAASLAAENRRLAAPASLDGGVTSGLQEDMLCHPTPAALKALDILANTRTIIAIELLAACQSYDLLDQSMTPAPGTAALYTALRGRIGAYADDRPLADDIAAAVAFIDDHAPGAIVRDATGIEPVTAPA